MKKSSTRICILTSIHPDYDARVFRHACSVAEAGYQVDLICPWSPPRLTVPANLRVLRFERAKRTFARPVVIARRLLPFLVGRKYDLYHFHDLDLLPLMSMVRVITRRPVVYDCHENYSQEMLTRAYQIPQWSRSFLAWGVKWSERAAASVIREVVTVVPQQARTFPAPWFRTTLVRNYAELSLGKTRAPDAASRPAACISTASQYVTNGALFYLDVAREVLKSKPDVDFYAVDRFGSDDRLRSEFLRRLNESGIQHRFHLLENVLPHDIMNQLNRASIGLSLNLEAPDQVAALPIKLVEYMAAGLPIVAADLPNIRHLNEEASSMLLAKPGDAKDFADCIVRLLEDSTLASRLSENGLAAFRSRLNWEAEMKKMFGMYERLLDATT